MDTEVAVVCAVATANGLIAWDRNDPVERTLQHEEIEPKRFGLLDLREVRLRLPRLALPESTCAGVSQVIESSFVSLAQEQRRVGEHDADHDPELLEDYRNSRILYPNTMLEVHVLRCHDAPVSVSVTGTPHQGRTEVWSMDAEAATTAPTPAAYATSGLVRIPPREPGPVVVQFSRGEGAARQVATVEYFAERRYRGALRLGMAVVTPQLEVGGRSNEVYDLAPIGDGVSTVRSAAAGPIAELVAGYAFYLPVCGIPGRAMHTLYRDCNGPQLLVPSPWVGIAVVSSASVSSVQAFRAAHIGLDWELTPYFAFGLSARLGREQVLRNEYSVGDEVRSGTSVTREVAGLRGAVTLSFSPSFWRSAIR